MKKLIAVLGLMVLLGTAVTFVSAQSATKPEKGVLVGTVVEITTYATKGLSEETVAAGKSRAEQGFPIGLLEEETGEVWVCAYRNTAPASVIETANKYLGPFIGQKVAVQGLLYRAKGLNYVRVSVASEY